jgi:hypothetical protein
MIGRIDFIDTDPVTGTYLLKVRTAVNFYDVQHAYVVRNLLQDEMDQLKKNIQDKNE